MDEPFFVMSLDGGGAKGVYTLGVLNELEQYWGEPLFSRFRLIYGTSTGAIIAALLASGKTVPEVESLYFELVPRVMKHKSRAKRTVELKRVATEILGNKTFEDLRTGVGIVATNYDSQRPMIFKGNPAQATSMQASFQPGFGCSLSDAVVASAAAFPFFEQSLVHTSNQGDPVLIDGGFAANNPTLLAIAEAHQTLKIPYEKLKVLSVGVGHYKEPKKSVLHKIVFSFWPFQIIQKMFTISTNTMEGLREVLFPHIACVRIDDSYSDAQYATDLLESDPIKLRKLFVLGRDSYRKHIAEIETHFPAKSR